MLLLLFKAQKKNENKTTNKQTKERQTLSCTSSLGFIKDDDAGHQTFHEYLSRDQDNSMFPDPLKKHYLLGTDHTLGEGYSLVYEQAWVSQQHPERVPACGWSGPCTAVGKDEQEQLVQGLLAGQRKRVCVCSAVPYTAFLVIVLTKTVEKSSRNSSAFQAPPSCTGIQNWPLLSTVLFNTA